jgi:hypothetical protein
MNIKPQKETFRVFGPSSTRTLANEGDLIRSKDEFESGKRGRIVNSSLCWLGSGMVVGVF